MLGAVAGDIIGSVHEFLQEKTMDFPLFLESSRFNDDTVLTVAVADCLLTGRAVPRFPGHRARLAALEWAAATDDAATVATTKLARVESKSISTSVNSGMASSVGDHAL